MKHIKGFKIFENGSFSLDENIFINYLYNITDENNLFIIEDNSFLKQGHLFINSSNFQEGYFYKSYNDWDSKSVFNITMIKRGYEYPPCMDYDTAKGFLMKEHNKLYNDINTFIIDIKKIFNIDKYKISNSFSVGLVGARDLKFYEINISFQIKELEYKQTSHYKTLNMLKQLGFDDEYKQKLKDIGYDLDES